MTKLCFPESHATELLANREFMIQHPNFNTSFNGALFKNQPADRLVHRWRQRADHFKHTLKLALLGGVVLTL